MYLSLMNQCSPASRNSNCKSLLVSLNGHRCKVRVCFGHIISSVQGISAWKSCIYFLLLQQIVQVSTESENAITENVARLPLLPMARSQSSGCDLWKMCLNTHPTHPFSSLHCVFRAWLFGDMHGHLLKGTESC